MAYENGRRILGYFKKRKHKYHRKKSFMRRSNLKWEGDFNPAQYCNISKSFNMNKYRLHYFMTESHNDFCWYSDNGNRQICVCGIKRCPYKYWEIPHNRGWKPPKLIQKLTNKRVRQQSLDCGFATSDYRKILCNHIRPRY